MNNNNNLLKFTISYIRLSAICIDDLCTIVPLYASGKRFSPETKAVLAICSPPILRSLHCGTQSSPGMLVSDVLWAKERKGYFSVDLTG